VISISRLRSGATAADYYGYDLTRDYLHHRDHDRSYGLGR